MKERETTADRLKEIVEIVVKSAIAVGILGLLGNLINNWVKFAKLFK